jgi:NADPH-ferrihemoprotein reductase
VRLIRRAPLSAAWPHTTEWGPPRNAGFAADVIDLENFDPAKLQEGVPSVFLLATYGDGDPTDNALGFYKWMKNEDGSVDPEAMRAVKYLVFGLGNTQYEHYNKMGKETDT